MSQAAATPVPPAPSAGLSHAWRALSHRNFRLFFLGQSVSLIGTHMTRLATSWLVYRMTNSALMLGIVGFSGQILAFVLQPVAGVWVERLEKRNLLVWTQVAAAIQSLVMAALTLSHMINIWEVIGLSALQGLINALDTPARQSFLVQMVDDRNDLSNAIAINSSMANGARLIGPAIAGVLIAAVGEGWCFFLDGLSYVPVITSLVSMRLAVQTVAPHKATMLAQIREGWEYVSGDGPMRVTLILFAWTSLMGFPYAVLLPVFAADVLHGGAHTLGWLLGASGAGALVSALSLTVRRSTAGLSGMIQLSSAVLGVALILFGFSTSLPVSLLLMVFAGFGLMQSASATNTLVQSMCADGMRGRVMSYYTMAFFGAAPFGSLLAGAFAHHVGAPATVIFTGICCLAGAVWFSGQRQQLRAKGSSDMHL